MKIKIFSHNSLKKLLFFTLIPIFLYSCNGKFPGADARKFPANPEERVKKNIEEGRGFTLNNELFESGKGGVFEFASANELWRASLDVIDFMPLSSVNYSGGVIITDWYSSDQNSNESIKISIRFLTNEIRSDALKIKVFNRNCETNFMNCKISENNGALTSELKKEILAKASLYKEEDKNKKKNKKK